MAHVTTNYTDTKVLFIDEKSGKAEGFDYLERVTEQDAIKALRKEADQRGSVTKAALSVLVAVLSAERLSGYQGQSKPGEGLSKEFKEGLRDSEATYLRPILLDSFHKGMSQAEKDKAADRYISELRAGGVYALVKNYASKYFTIVGQLPCVYNADGTPDTDKLLSVDIIKKLLSIHASENVEAPSDTFKNKHVKAIVKCATDFNTRSEEANPDANEVGAALAALKSMIASFEGMARDYAEARTKAGSSVGATQHAGHDVVANKAISNAKNAAMQVAVLM